MVIPESAIKEDGMTMQPMSTETAEATSVRWGNPQLQLVLSWGAGVPVRISTVVIGLREQPLYALPLVELLTASGGHVPASDRLAHTAAGSELRYVGHRVDEADGWSVLEIVQASESLEVTVRLEMPEAVAAVRSRVTVVNRGSERIVLRSVPSWNSGFTAAETDGDVLDGWARVTGRSDWLGEGRWERQSLRGPDFPSLAEDLTGHDPRGSLALTSDGTWSTGRALPTAALVNESARLAVAWQVEHNGAWRWEIGEDTARRLPLALRADRC